MYENIFLFMWSFATNEFPLLYRHVKTFKILDIIIKYES